METHVIAFRKRPNIRLEFTIQAANVIEARKIASREMKPMHGFTYAGTSF